MIRAVAAASLMVVLMMVLYVPSIRSAAQLLEQLSLDRARTEAFWGREVATQIDTRLQALQALLTSTSAWVPVPLPASLPVPSPMPVNEPTHKRGPKAGSQPPPQSQSQSQSDFGPASEPAHAQEHAPHAPQDPKTPQDQRVPHLPSLAASASVAAQALEGVNMRMLDSSYVRSVEALLILACYRAAMLMHWTLASTVMGLALAADVMLERRRKAKELRHFSAHRFAAYASVTALMMGSCVMALVWPAGLPPLVWALAPAMVTLLLTRTAAHFRG